MVGMPDGAFVYIFGEECMEVRQLWRPTIMYTIYIQYIYILQKHPDRARKTNAEIFLHIQYY